MSRFTKIIIIQFLVSLCFYQAYAQGTNEWQIIQKKWIHYSDIPNLLYHHLAKESYQLLDKHEKNLAQIKTTADWKKRQALQKEAIWKAIGKFPSKTPLNVRVTSIVQKDNYRIENIIYESLPNYFVTASLFIPTNIKGTAPAILFCSGHSAQAYRRDVYQVPLLNLVNKGFVVLAIDPVSQGERIQYWDDKKKASMIGGSTSEHSYPAPQSFLIGQSVARYFVWDGIRGIDYLVSRPEVDPKRIGVHGLSGGGTQTAYIAALDDRVVAAAPSGYITGYKRLIESIGVQDGEQNFYHGLKNGIDHADFIEIRAPKPTLIMATTSDFFNISGTRDVYDRVKKSYAVFGKSDNIEMVEGDYVHGYTQNIREKMYAFFQKHLQNPGIATEDALPLMTEQELQKTKTGQIASSEQNVETVFSLNKKEASISLSSLQNQRANQLEKHLQSVRSTSSVLAGIKLPSKKERAIFTGRTIKDTYHIERYFIKGEGEYPIPYLVLKPLVPIKKVVLYVHPEGKAKAMESNFENWLTQGIAIVVPDLLGVGELAPVNHKGDATIQGVSYNIWFTSVLNGKSIVGVQASDLVRLVQSEETLLKDKPWTVVAQNEMAPAVLHAAAISNVFDNIALINPYGSYQNIVESNLYKPQYVFSLVAGALNKYDLPDLAASLAPRKLLILDAVDATGALLTGNQAKENYHVVERSYTSRNKSSHFQLSQNEPNVWAKLTKWLE